MFSARLLILIYAFFTSVYSYILSKIADYQRKKPLPAEVSDIYDKERYQTYINYVADNKKLANKYKFIDTILLIVVILSPIYAYIEKLCGGNVYYIFFATFLLFWVISTIIGTLQNYESTFKIEEKYELNKKTKKEFVKDEIINNVLEVFLMGALGVILTFIGEHMSRWTNNFSIGIVKALLICVGIGIVIFAFVVVAQRISYFALHKQYTFTPMEEGELKDKINSLQKDAKKKVKNIFVYDESKKSTSKNAFLLKMLFYKEFGIADNFMMENAEDELLAVLSHEIGHLKHKKNILNYLSYSVFVVGFALIVCLIAYPEIALSINKWIRDSFNINVNSYYLIMTVYMDLITPISFFIKVFNNYRVRTEEYEADREAVKNGYGQELITTFKKLSSDELVNVNPHPFIEFLEYDHPGMYRRIKAINEAEKGINK